MSFELSIEGMKIIVLKRENRMGMRNANAEDENGMNSTGAHESV